MRLFLLRHATRSYGIGDAPLNEEGLEQAHQLALSSKLQGISLILTSPKKRAQMTIAPLSAQLSCPVQVMMQLDQQLSIENNGEFKKRVQKLIHHLEEHNQDNHVLICSHSDWLSVATEILENKNEDFYGHLFQCAEYIAYDFEEGLWTRVKTI